MDNRQFNIELLGSKLSDAEELLDKYAFGDAMLMVSEVLVVAQERYLDDIVSRARALQQRIIMQLETFKKNADRFRLLQDEVDTRLSQKKYQEVVSACQEFIKLAPVVRKGELVNKYQKILEDCQLLQKEVFHQDMGILPRIESRRQNIDPASNVEGSKEKTLNLKEEDLRKVEYKAIQLRRVEEIFQNEFIDAHYEACLEILGLLIQLSEDLANFDRVELYKHLQKVLRKHLTHKELRGLLNPELMEAIEKQKTLAQQFERNLKFREARKIYEEVLRMAKNLKEEITIALCEQKITQLIIWEEEMARSDLTKWTIPPFRIICRARFDCLELFPDRASAEVCKNSLISQRVNPDNIKIITIIRARFKNQGPFDATGTCYAIYIRRAWDFDE